MSKEVSSEQLAKLPKWAQSHIAQLERDKRDLTENVLQLSGVVKSDTYSALLDPGYGKGATEVRQNIDAPHGLDIKLPKREDDAKYVERKFIVKVRDGQLQVMATGYPSSLVVIPQASNVVAIDVVQNPMGIR